MNRFLRAVISSASIVGGLAGAPALAHAQPVNVAPPAYVRPTVPQPAPDARNPNGDADRHYARGYGGAYSRDRHDGYGGPEGWQAQFRRDRWDRAFRQHMRECARAYQTGAPPWVLERMRCPAY
jgi:hypothetical protein